MLRCIEAGLRIGYMPGVHVHQYLHTGERLSLGQNKIEGERDRHELVKSYYPMLDSDDIRYVEFRHNAVLAVSAKRSGDFRGALSYSCKAIAASPRLCVQEAARLVSNRKRLGEGYRGEPSGPG